MNKLLTSLLALVVAGAIQAVNIIPQPASVVEAPGEFSFADGWNISSKSDAGSRAVQLFTEYLADDYGLKPSGMANILLRDKASLASEEYRLEIKPHRIIIEASADAGFFYAFASLRQLLLADSAHTAIPCMTVMDKPRFSYRGFLMDSGRFFISVEDVKKAIDMAAAYKLNRFHWHLTDDMGWRIQIDKYPLLTELGSTRQCSAAGSWDQYCPPLYDGKENSGYYTKDQLRDIVRYAADRGITILPEIEMPGHALAALSAYPQYACGFHSDIRKLAGMGISNKVFCPKPETFEFIRDVLTEVAEIFPGEYIHIGADECPTDSWEQCDDCQALIKREGLKNEKALHAYFIQQVEKIGDSLGRKIIGWDEILEGGLPLKAAVMSWHGADGGIAAARMGNKVVMTPTSYCYLDYYQEYPQYAPLCIGGFIPLEKVYSYEPVPDELTPQEAELIMGTAGNIWGEYVQDIAKYEYLAYPRLIAIAEVAWSSPEARNADRFMANLRKEYDYFALRHVNASREFLRPLLEASFNRDAGAFEVSMRSVCPGMTIYYTVDGTEPGPWSTPYTGPVKLDADACVKAVLADADGVHATPAIRNYAVNKATGCPYTLSAEPYSLDWYAVKPTLFTDGCRGFSPSNYEWGAIVPGTEIVIDLLRPTAVSRVSFGTMAAPVNSVMPAASAVCYVSDNGTDFTKAGESTFTYPPYKGEKQIFRNTVATGNATGRYLKLVINGQTEVPDYYPYNSLPALALDEIEIY